VSFNEAPLHNLASFLHKILSQNLPIQSVTRATHIALISKRFSYVIILADYSFVSLDVISLYINVPVDLAIKNLEEI